MTQALAAIIAIILGGNQLDPLTDIIPEKTITPISVGFVQNNRHIAPIIKASSSAVFDLKSGAMLFGSNIDEKRQIASITKLVTALVVLDEVANLSQIVSVHPTATTVPGSKAYLKPGEYLTAESLLKALLIKSANDAAYALAIHISGSKNAFAEKMNHKASLLGMTQSHFSNPAGFDDEENYSTVRDLILLTKEALSHPKIREIVQKPQDTIYSTNKEHVHYLKNTNDLLGSYLNVTGLKTGYTSKAGESLVSLSRYNGSEVVSIVLNSPDRFQESKVLLDWSYASYTWP